MEVNEETAENPSEETTVSKENTEENSSSNEENTDKTEKSAESPEEKPAKDKSVSLLGHKSKQSVRDRFNKLRGDKTQVDFQNELLDLFEKGPEVKIVKEEVKVDVPASIPKDSALIRLGKPRRKLLDLIIKYRESKGLKDLTYQSIIESMVFNPGRLANEDNQFATGLPKHIIKKVSDKMREKNGQ